MRSTPAYQISEEVKAVRNPGHFGALIADHIGKLETAAEGSMMSRVPFI